MIYLWEERRSPDGGAPYLHRYWSSAASLKQPLDFKFAPGHLEFSLAAALEKGSAIHFDLTQARSPPVHLLAPGGKDCLALSWNKGGDRPMLAIGVLAGAEGGKQELLSFWEFDGAWVRFGEMMPATANAKMVRELSWAPQNGRSGHFLAVATENAILVVKFRLDNEKGRAVLAEPQTFKLDEDGSLFCLRLSWNLMATSLAVSFSNRSMKIFKRKSGEEFAVSKVLEPKEIK